MLLANVDIESFASFYSVELLLPVNITETDSRVYKEKWLMHKWKLSKTM